MIDLIIFDWKRTLYDPDTKELIEGALDLLDYLKSSHIPMILVGKGRKDMDDEVKRLRVGDYFKKVVFAGGEKDPSIFAPYISKTDPKKTLFIGDRVRSELEIGNKLGATTIWVKQGKFASELPENKDQEPDYTVLNLNDCLNLILNSYQIIRKIYEDDYILVLDKPPGLVVDPAETVKGETLVYILQKDFHIQLPRGGIVHRLDKDTSGVILVAKTPASLENLQNQFKERQIKKEYLTLVHGQILKPGIVEGNIGRNPGNREKFIVLEEGKEAVTEYEPIEKFKIQSSKFKIIFSDFNKIQMRKLEKQRYGEVTLLKCKPKTGRTHQIRVHLKYIGSPIVADEKYVGRKMYRLDKRWCPRIFLHAQKIGFKHPTTGEWMELESELPEDLKKALGNFK